MNRTRGRFGSRAATLGVFIALTLSAAVARAVVVRTAVAYRPAAPVARAAVRTAAVVGTAAVIGSRVNTLPPSCSSVVVGNVAYQQCGSSWYQPQYAGSQVTYVVVNPPR
jgi:hypothetical protein